jgi:hypothetical protein
VPGCRARLSLDTVSGLCSASTPQLITGTEWIGGTTDLAARLSGFMGIALCLLAVLKPMDVPSFAASLRKYDLLNQHWRAWAGLYPGVELLVGLGILLRLELSVAARRIGATTLLLGLTGTVSVGCPASTRRALAAAAVLPATEQILEFAVQVAQGGDPLLDLANLAADRVLQRRAGAHS